MHHILICHVGEVSMSWFFTQDMEEITFQLSVFSLTWALICFYYVQFLFIICTNVVGHGGFWSPTYESKLVSDRYINANTVSTNKLLSESAYKQRSNASNEKHDTFLRHPIRLLSTQRTTNLRSDELNHPLNERLSNFAALLSYDFASGLRYTT